MNGAYAGSAGLNVAVTVVRTRGERCGAERDDAVVGPSGLVPSVVSALLERDRAGGGRGVGLVTFEVKSPG